MSTDTQDATHRYRTAEDRRFAAHPASIYSAFHSTDAFKTKDGVFSNMISSSDTSQNPPGPQDAVPSRPPGYGEVASMRPPNYSVEAPAIFRLLQGGSYHGGGLFGGGSTSTGRPPSVSDILIDGIPLGSWSSFFGPMAVVVISQFVGFLLTLMLVRSHAGHHGAFAGLGLLLAIFALNGSLESANSGGLMNSGNERLLDPPTISGARNFCLGSFSFGFHYHCGPCAVFLLVLFVCTHSFEAAQSLSQLQAMEQQA